jgi:hypothetical protein
MPEIKPEVKVVLACTKCGHKRYFSEEPVLQATNRMWCPACYTYRAFAPASETPCS